MSRFSKWMILAATAGCLAGPAVAVAAALEPDEIRGEITEVRPEENIFSIRVAEAGEERPAETGSVETYEIDDATEITFEDPRESLLSPRTMTLDDIEPGADVRLNFEEIDGRRMARDVAVSDDGQGAGEATADAGGATAGEEGTGEAETELAAAEGTRERLPETASMAPVLAFGGLGFAIAALMLRSLRKRQRR